MREDAVKEFGEDLVTMFERHLPSGSRDDLEKKLRRLREKSESMVLDSGDIRLKAGSPITVNAREFTNGDEPHDTFKAGPRGYCYTLKAEDGGIRFDLYSNDEELASEVVCRTSYNFEYADSIEVLAGDTTILRVPNAHGKWINVGSGYDGRGRLGSLLLYIVLGDGPVDSIVVAGKTIDLREHFGFLKETLRQHELLSILQRCAEVYHKGA